jgi:hypothetical protein
LWAAASGVRIAAARRFSTLALDGLRASGATTTLPPTVRVVPGVLTAPEAPL